MTSSAVALLLMLAGSPAPAGGPAGDADLASAEALYAQAAYEDALTTLSSINGAPAEQVERYRALCLLALGRTAEAQRSLEHIVQLSPFYEFSPDQVSPRLIEMFHEVRRRMLPDAARTRYAEAKVRFGRKQFDEAARLFNEVVQIVKDEDASGAAADLADLATLSQGFLELARASDVPAPAPVRAAPPAPAPTAAAPAPVAPRIYTSDDANVVPPTDIDRRLPAWNPPTRSALAPNRGTLDLVVSETGTVESVVMRASVSPFYDDVLMKMAKTWRFHPATLDGQPVKYLKRLVIQIAVPR
jgi:hypothetical protein